ncbi:tripartite ATP-independent transporter DctM subunit [Palleronia aestuarii]|uniref:TRAP transporter large permease protein n=1 Tax=Palleronia aestuarii TaxID=568105 RepID=A0A2W7NP43_9RHOB|nr:TRAP transporter large permease [Palleronia aestuarii]PZX13042.1 tripartite ATP-independent transporter DctM subunit [Palleronia aestuarii]
MTLAGITALLFAMLANGAPVAFAMLGAGVIGIYLVAGSFPLDGVLATAPYETVASYTLSTLPMFILMGEFLTAGRYTRDVFDASHRWLGHLRGGLGYAAITGGVLLAAVTGSSTAAASTLAGAAYPEMKRYGYKDSLSTATLAVIGTLAILIPPSVTLIIYGILTETSVGALLIAGVAPGILTALGFVTAIKVSVTRDPNAAPVATERYPLRQRIVSLGSVWPVMLLMFFLLGGIYSGAVTVTEIGAVGALAAFLIAMLMGRLTVGSTIGALVRTARSSAMILTIIASAAVFGIFITLTQAPQQLLTFVQEAGLDRRSVLLAVLCVLLMLGFFLDQLAILVLTMPIVFPILIGLQFDPVWLGIIVIKTVEIGLITPPMGLNCFVVSSVTGVPVHRVFRGVWIFVGIDLAILAILAAFPEISLFLPRWAGIN